MQFDRNHVHEYGLLTSMRLSAAYRRNHFNAGTDFRRQILKSKVDLRTDRVKYV